jgi:hypothetical protein
MDVRELIAAVASMITFTIMVICLTFILTRRSRARAKQDLSPLDDRLLRIEQAVDSVAVEVERISEAQRFATKLLTERERAQVSTERSAFDRK